MQPRTHVPTQQLLHAHFSALLVICDRTAKERAKNLQQEMDSEKKW